MIKNFGIVDPKDYKGLTLKEAQDKAKDKGFTTRVVESDGNSLMITEDLKNNRVNFRVSNGKVTDAYPG